MKLPVYQHHRRHVLCALLAVKNSPNRHAIDGRLACHGRQGGGQSVWLTTSHRMRRCEHIVQQRRQPRPAKFWAWRPPSSVISRSDTAALPKVSTGLPTNSIELERLRAVRRRALVGKTDFSPMSRSQLANEKSHVCRTRTAETASPR